MNTLKKLDDMVKAHVGDPEDDLNETSIGFQALADYARARRYMLIQLSVDARLAHFQQSKCDLIYEKLPTWAKAMVR